MIAENLSLINTYSKTKPSMDFYAKYVEFSELENVLALQQYIYDRIPNKEIFVRDTMDDFIVSERTPPPLNHLTRLTESEGGGMNLMCFLRKYKPS